MPSLGSTKRNSAASTVDLPAPDGPVRARRVPGRACEGDARECGALPVLVLHAEAVDRQDRAAGARHGTVAGGTAGDRLVGLRRGRDGRREHLDDPRRSGLPLGAGVELGPGAAHRDEDLGRDEEDGHGGLQVELAPQQAKPEHHGDEPDAEPGDHVHGERGQEGDTERAHGGGPDAFGRRLDLAAALRRAAEGAQGGEPFDELQDPTGERAQPAPLALGPPGRLPAERDHRHGHGQHQDDDHHEGQPILRGHPDQQDHRDDGGRGRLGQVARVVGVERAQPPGGGQRELARALAAQPARSQGQGVLQQLTPERRDDAVGGAQAPRDRRRRGARRGRGWPARAR